MNLAPLLSLIRRLEARGDYNIVWGGIRKEHRPAKPITQLTVAQVLAWQDSIDRQYMSEAAGAYQILEDTLRDIHGPAGVKGTDLFDVATQDKLGRHLLVRRGLNEYAAGRISTESFGLRLAQEWASLPVPFDVKRPVKGKPAVLVRRGSSYYSGDGLNKAHCSVDEFLEAIRAIREPVPVPAPAPKPAPQPPIATPATTGKGAGRALALIPTETPMKTVVAKEAERILRHALTPLAVAAVAQGWLPAVLSGPIVDGAVIVGAAGISLIWSKVAAR